MKNTFVLLLCTALFACNQSSKKGNTADTTQRSEDTVRVEQSILDDSVAKTPASTDSTKTKTVVIDKLIIPGRSIGRMQLSGDVASVSTLLGRPDSADAAMGSSLMVWFTQNHKPTGYRVSVFAHRKMGTKDEIISRIQKILVTSPEFKTVEDYGVGTSFEDIKKSYDLKPTDAYNDKNGKVQIYTDLDKGISFEIGSANKCVGIVVHKPHDTAAAYLNMH